MLANSTAGKGDDPRRSAVVDARQADAVAFLDDAAEGSFGAVIAIQVVEHLSLDALLTLIELAFTRLRPGGRLIFETPNPASLIVLGNSYLLDPTHVRPLLGPAPPGFSPNPFRSPH